MPQASSGSRIQEQLDHLLELGCCEPGEMIVFPVRESSNSLDHLRNTPGIVIERIGPDVVRVRREA